MNSIHRIGLAIASLATVLVVGSAFVIGGYLSASTIASAATASSGPTYAPTEAPTTMAAPTLDPETIYIESAPTPATVTIGKTAPPATGTIPKPTPKTTPPVIHVVVPGPTGEDDGGGDD